MSTDFSRSSQYELIKFFSGLLDMVHADDKQTDRYDEANQRFFRNLLAYAPEINNNGSIERYFCES
jgi:hypothetical protein